jgi:hypothetical protein
VIRKLFRYFESAADSDVSAQESCGERSVAGCGIRSERDLAELREFLAADGCESECDPAFKERLRIETWSSFLARFDTPPGSLSH